MTRTLTLIMVTMLLVPTLSDAAILDLTGGDLLKSWEHLRTGAIEEVTIWREIRSHTFGLADQITARLPKGQYFSAEGEPPDGIELSVFEREMDRIIQASTYYADVWKDMATVAGEYAVGHRFSGSVTDETLRLALSLAEQFPALEVSIVTRDRKEHYFVKGPSDQANVLEWWACKRQIKPAPPFINIQ